MDMEREKALKEVMAADFTCYDLVLYLNTHPNDIRALSIYNNALQNARIARDNYERKYGPLTVCGAWTNMSTWEWAQTSWPWEME